MSADKHPSIPLDFTELTEAEMLAASRDFCATLHKRRTVRDFSARPVPAEIIHNAVRAAGAAPSGANKQPWHFAIVSSAKIKKAIRKAAEAEEREFYQHRASESWLRDLAPLGTDADKPFLETAPWLIAVFLQKYSFDGDGNKQKHYYMPESVGIACGMLLCALHLSGLATLTHTPSPMGFLGEILHRPSNEKPYLLVVAGYPAADARVPAIARKPFDEIASHFD